MRQKNAMLFAAGHVILPAALILFLSSGESSTGRTAMLLLTAASLLWTFFLCGRAFVRQDLHEMLQGNMRWTLFAVDSFLLAVLYALHEPAGGILPLWLALFVVPLYGLELGTAAAAAFSALQLASQLAFILIREQPIPTGSILLCALGMLTLSIVLGRSAAALRKLTLYDGLTGLPNRELFRQRLAHALRPRKGGAGRIGVLFLDLDRFKYVNDTMGHEAGDRLLEAVALLLGRAVPRGTLLARMGGDEFALLLPDANGADEAEPAAVAALESLQKPILLDGRDVYVTASIGIAVSPQDGANPETLMKNADTALYRAKELGRNNYQLYSPPAAGESLYGRITMESMLRKALDKRELEVYYQPRINARNGELTAVEALIRWNHPEEGGISPAEFIPLAEDTGLVVPLGEFVLRTACAQVKRWNDLGYPPMRVSVNLSPRQFRQKDLPEVVGEVLKDTGLPPNKLELEITEGAAMHNVNMSILVLRILKDLGVLISIDDFGTGYSSLNYLKRLPIDTVKIDRSFIMAVHDDPDDAAIVSAIIALSHILGLKVTAEGVETKAQLDYLEKLECDEIQGYLFGKAMPARTFEAWLAVRRETEIVL